MPTAIAGQGKNSSWAMNEAVLSEVEGRLGRLHAKQRLGIEAGHTAQIFGQGLTFCHIENWYSIHSVVRTPLKLKGLYRRGPHHAECVQIRHTDIRLKGQANLTASRSFISATCTRT
jgi:uncharacterized protein